MKRIITKFYHWLRIDGKLYGVLFLLYSILTLALTYPAVKGVFLQHTVPGYGDAVFFQYDYWWFKYALFDLRVNPQVARLIYFPLGGLWIFGTLFNEVFSALLQLVMSVSQTYTLLWLFSFPATALSTFVLTNYVTHSKSASFLSGLIFAFSTYRYAHGLGHMGLITTQWLPLFVYALLRDRDLPDIKNGIFLTIAVILAGTSEFPYYLVFFIGLFLFCFFLYSIAIRDYRFLNVRFLFSIFIAFGILCVVLAIAYSNVLFASNAGYLNRPGTFWLSADILGFILPSQWHPFWGGLYAEPGSIGRYGLDLVEHSHFIGYVAFGLAVWGLIRSRQQDKKLWGIIILSSFVFALGPALKIGGPVVLKAINEGQTSLIPLPYWGVMNLPFINRLRAPARLVVLMQLAIAVMAAMGWVSFEKKIKRFEIKRGISVGIIGVIVLVESMFMFPYVTTEIPISDVYYQLANENVDGAILELPIALDRQPPEGRWYGNVFLRMYEATVHHHPIIGGISNRPDPNAMVFNATTPYIRELVGADRKLQQDEDPFHQDWSVLERVGPSILQSYNIDYVVLHKDALFSDEFTFLNETITRQIGESFFDDGTVRAYRVVANSVVEWPTVDKLVFIAGKGWYLPLWNGEKMVRRMFENGEIVLLSPELQKVQLVLTWNSRPDQGDKVVRILINDHLLETVGIPTAEKTLLSLPFTLEKGYNLVSIERIGDMQYSDQMADVMQYDLQVSQLNIIPSDVPQVSQSLSARLGQNIALDAVNWQIIGREEISQTLQVTLHWRAINPVEESFKVFVHILDENGDLIAQDDSVPVNWFLPTNVWQPGDVVIDRHQVVLPPDSQVSEIRIGMYHPESMDRLNVLVLDGVDVKSADSTLRLQWVDP